MTRFGRYSPLSHIGLCPIPFKYGVFFVARDIIIEYRSTNVQDVFDITTILITDNISIVILEQTCDIIRSVDFIENTIFCWSTDGFTRSPLLEEKNAGEIPLIAFYHNLCKAYKAITKLWKIKCEASKDTIDSNKKNLVSQTTYISGTCFWRLPFQMSVTISHFYQFRS